METELNRLYDRLSRKLSQPLPGEKSQLQLSPVRRRMASGISDRSQVKQGAVLIAFYPKKGEIYTVFIERTVYEGVHSGQIGFPGGRIEAHDEDLFQTAIREANEEVNISGEEVRVAGSLTEVYIPPSNFLVLPVVGVLSRYPQFIPEEKEVGAIVETPIKVLMEDTIIGKETVDLRNGMQAEVPAYVINNKVVWGATAMMVSELRDVLKSL